MGEMVETTSVVSKRPSFVLATAMTYGTQLLVAVLSLGNVLVISWALGAEGRGNVALLTTIAYLTGSLSTLGIEQANANIAARTSALRATLATNSLAFAAIVGSAAALAVGVLFWVVDDAGGDIGWNLRLLALAAVPMIIFQLCLDYLVRAEYGFAWANAAWLLQPVVNVGANGILAASGHLTVARAVVFWEVGQALTAAVLVWYILSRGSGFGKPSRPLLRQSLSFGVRAHAGRAFTVGNYRLDQWILGAVAGARELGVYSVAVSWAEILFFLPTVIVLVQRPILVQLSGEGARAGAARVFRVAILLTAPLAVLLILLAPFLCTTLFPASFGGSADQLRVLALGCFGIVALKLLGNALTARDRPLLTTTVTGIAFCITVILDVTLIPLYGGMGAAIASAVAYTAGGVLIGVFFKRALKGRAAELFPGTKDLAALIRLPKMLLQRGG
jgi:O-antigen/teichoic acid export membrane protein